LATRSSICSRNSCSSLRGRGIVGFVGFVGTGFLGYRAYRHESNEVGPMIRRRRGRWLSLRRFWAQNVKILNFKIISFWENLSIPNRRYEGQGYCTENSGTRNKSSLSVHSVKGVSAFPFLIIIIIIISLTPIELFSS
jgi:hypothetical protein